ncbi:EAL domain-containing protein [Xinfangfangia sp. D13-10-4-6]|uniref:EAL domain-containing protein n=1 Tax=Pseudogemmobacter hezensis TaxID=2737662 RepID=UPI0015581F3A|nr:EAL domain-containing protein [Pseudogemmobacter hezensis]NPD13986.1 EAL domain-containing protein [Pseudogemmobacter hezensis]
MSFVPVRRQLKVDLDPNEASPFAIATSSAERAVLQMVRDALTNKRMRLAFQPAVYAADPQIIGFYEGYIRLLDERQMTIPARDFMAISETRELGREIDVAALRLGLQTLRRNPGIRIAVNMSARSVGYKPWTQLLRRTLGEHPDVGRGLILEINEASAMQMPDVLIPFMDELQGFGITFTLDDFGDSFTSLSLLYEFGFDIAKLDGRFIRDCHIDATNQPVIRSAIAMAQEFGMFLVAEAVETNDEANWLREQGVGCLQGYLFGKPELTPDFAQFLRSRRRGGG